MFDELTKKQKFILLTIALIVLVLLTLIIKGALSPKPFKIDYKSADGASLVEFSNQESSRTIFYELNDIVKKYIDSFDEMDLFGDKKADYIPYTKYYDVLDDNYKSYLKKERYVEIANAFYKKYNYSFTDGEYQFDNIIIDTVYKFMDDMYISTLISRSEEKMYIGIKLIPNASEYKIFFIE